MILSQRAASFRHVIACTGILFLGLATGQLIASDNGSSPSCPLPFGLTISPVSANTAVLTWTQSNSVDRIDVRWRVKGAADWIVQQGVTSPDTIDALEMCVEYEVEFKSVCADSFSVFGIAQTFETDGCCRLPTGFRISGNSATTASFAWDSVGAATGFFIRYKTRAATEWNEISVNGNGVVLPDLKECTAYDVQLRTRCNSDSTGFSDVFLLQTTGCDRCEQAAYCNAGAFDASMLWVDSVSLGSLQSKTGSNGGSVTFSGSPPMLERNRSYAFYVSPGISGDTCPVFLRAWLDTDQDGIFNDSTEMILDAIDSTGSGASSVVVLSDALELGIVRMRIIAAYATDTIGPQQCGIIDFGEVEDYCVSIGDVCPRAIMLDTIGVEDKSASIMWEPGEKALAYIYRHREVGDDDWIDEQITQDTMVDLSDLKKCTDYEFQLVHVCIQDTTEQSLFFSTKCPSAVAELPPSISGIKVFPNPFASTFTLEITARESMESHYRIVNLMGQSMIEGQLDLLADVPVRLTSDALESAPAGVYLVAIRTGQNWTTLKLIKSER